MATPSYYNTGTASVANGATAVTGVGTAWTGLQAGDIFWAAGLSVRIASITDNTHLTLARNWPGTTLSSGAYEVRITPDASRMQEGTRQLLEVLSNGNLSSLAALTSAIDKIAYYTGSGTAALADFKSLARTFLTDIGNSNPATLLGLLGLGQAPVSGRFLTIKGSGATDGAILLKSSSDASSATAGLILQRNGDGAGYLWTYTGALAFGANNVEVGRFLSGGQLTLPYQPIWSATRNGLSPITSAGIIDWATPLINRGGHMSVSTHRWTSPGTGAARVTFAGFTDGGASATDIDASVRKNATAVTKLYGAAGAATGVSRYPSFCTVSVVSVDLNDILDLYLNAGSVRTGLYITASIEFIG